MRGRRVLLLAVLAACGGSTSASIDGANDAGGNDGGVPLDGSVMVTADAGKDTSSSDAPDASDAAPSIPNYDCTPGFELTGAQWSLAMSRFAFDSTPVVTMMSGETRYTGVDGVVVVSPLGNAMAVANGTSPARTVADWSSDPTALSAHVVSYFASFKVASCQVAGTQIFATIHSCNIDGGGGSGGGAADGGSDEAGMDDGGDAGDAGPAFVCPPNTRTIYLHRSVDKIPIPESMAYARIDLNDQTDHETLYWPTIPAPIVAEARAFQAKIATPAGLTAYQALLPTAAQQAMGTLNIHHTNGISNHAMHFAATWDVYVGPEQQSFDQTGAKVDLSML